MFFIPGPLIAILTFPGIIVHEFAHVLFCRLRKVTILEVCYFQTADPSGYVIHDEPSDFTSTFLISMGPFFVNSLLCVLICLPAFIPIHFFGIYSFLSYVLLWLGISIGMHAIPSNQDARNVFDQAKLAIKKGNPLAIISFPIIAAIFVFNLLRFFWADLIYASTLAFGVPALLF